jgi:geranylgeranyl diphosphate synthase type II
MTQKNTTSDDYPKFIIEIVNKGIKNLLEKYTGSPEILQKAIKYTMENGGKRFRPVLCLVTAKSLGSSYKPVLPTACAIEFIHTYSLIHDDLPSIDNDDFRRGKLTCHKVYGEDIALLTGDALFAEAFNIILKHQVCKQDVKLQILNEIGDASGASGMVAGQIVDVYFTGKKITKPMLEYMHYNKTARLIMASVRCGALLAGTDDDYLSRFTEYARNIGLVFQITDDLIDIESSQEETGKSSGKDSLQHKNTFPSIYGIKKSKCISKEKVEEAVSIIESMDIDGEWLTRIARFLLKRKS